MTTVGTFHKNETGFSLVGVYVGSRQRGEKVGFEYSPSMERTSLNTELAIKQSVYDQDAQPDYQNSQIYILIRAFKSAHFTVNSIYVNGCDGVVVRLLASHLSEQGSIPDNATGRRVFSGISRFPYPCIQALLHTHFSLIGSQDLDVKGRPNISTPPIVIRISCSPQFFTYFLGGGVHHTPARHQLRPPSGLGDQSQAAGVQRLGRATFLLRYLAHCCVAAAFRHPLRYQLFAIKCKRTSAEVTNLWEKFWSNVVRPYGSVIVGPLAFTALSVSDASAGHLAWWKREAGRGFVQLSSAEKYVCGGGRAEASDWFSRMGHSLSSSCDELDVCNINESQNKLFVKNVAAG
ncbi:hypothetical protein PR048_001296 [Dryococelus australis]|uniref:Uncharacterized protein n=1 Tax=Dryococelus australis TaxID=614101 RepID=A0ABQ9IGZ7_9NEOP|nr:hypothetical protein PR048_001296 [Dryococelus australis]